MGALTQALIEVAPGLEKGAEVNLASRIAGHFPKWPRKSSASSPRRDRLHDRLVWDVQDVWVTKMEDTGCGVELGPSVHGLFDMDPALQQAAMNIFDSPDGKRARPNEQLGEAKRKGASETVLLLDSHIGFKPNIIARALRGIDQALLSNIDAVFLVNDAEGWVEKVWP